jgi:hypothetical protein
VIAKGDRVGAGGQDFIADGLGEAEAARGVLAIDDGAIEPPALTQGGQAIRYGFSPGPADDIAKEEQAHAGQPWLGRMISASVTMKCKGWSCGSTGTRSISWAA